MTTPTDRTSARTKISTRLLGWTTAVTGLMSVSAVTALALTGHPEQAQLVGTIGAAVCVGGLGFTKITVNIRR